jgi:hypothetical protein
MLPDPAVYVELDKVKLWEANYNEGSIGDIYLSIKAFGFNQAIRLWKDNECRAGNHSVMALRLCQKENIIPKGDGCIVIDGRWYVRYVDISHLSETQALAFAIADNRMAEKASHDEAMLTDYLQRLRLMDENVFIATGYDDDDLERLNEMLTLPETFPEYDESVEDSVEYITCPHCGKQFPK